MHYRSVVMYILLSLLGAIVLVVPPVLNYAADNIATAIGKWKAGRAIVPPKRGATHRLPP